MAQGAAVRIEAVSKRFGELLANDAVSFGIAAGRMLGLVGENGAGKTTVMNVLAGIYLPDQGAVSVAGRPPSWAHRGPRSRLGSAWSIGSSSWSRPLQASRTCRSPAMLAGSCSHRGRVLRCTR